MSSRLPRVRRFEYLMAFLNSKRAQLSHGQIMEKIAQLKRDFEVEKHRAVGRGKPFSKVIGVSKSLVEECEKLALLSGLVDSEKAKLTTLGMQLVHLGNAEDRRRLLGRVLLEALPSFAYTVLDLSRLPNPEVVVPQERNKQVFSECVSKWGIDLSQMDFEIVRDWSTQLEISNWLIEDKAGKRFTKVYLCSRIQELADNGGDLVFRSAGSKYSVVFNLVDPALFKSALWEEYLKIAKFVPRKPVFYSLLRAVVCYRLKISDEFFDRNLTKLIEHDEEYLVVGSGGVLPRDKDWTSTLKYLPPKTERGEYLVYLRLDKR